MSLLETQYQNYLKENPDSQLTYEQWIELKFKTPPDGFQPMVSDDFQIGPDGAFEYDDDISDWDATLMDGLEDE
jgi:hypothetical protein